MDSRVAGRAGLSVNIGDAVVSSFDLHTHADNRGVTFRTAGLEIHSRGVVKDGAEHQFSVMYEDLDIAEVIGRGSSSFVLRARHIGTDRPLALKVINLFDRGKRHQLINEINALYNASHANVIEFLGAFYREGSVTIVTEYMDGGSLLNVLQQVGAIPERALSSMAYQVLLALSYMKQEKRLHRDIKPSNLLINSQGVVKVTDFGISTSLQGSFAMCGTFVGTFQYMSPERIKNEKYSYSSDVWSLGLVLMECATKEYPFRGEMTAIDLVQTIVDAPAPELDPSRFSTELCRFVAECLQKKPEDRTPTEALLGSPWVTSAGGWRRGEAT
ncbi:unnamed protein product [Pylaiella littoralis]